MPKLSSAETPPEKSSACLPVSTIALSGAITRMPLVCMSMVASAFQYGCAPTLMPVTTTLISPPACDAGAADVVPPPRLRKPHDPPQGGRHPVHVLRAGVHRDFRARGQREPL